MIDEEKLKKHVEEKCYEIKHREAIYLSRRKDLLADFEKYKKDIVGDALISDRAILSREAHITYENLKFETKQLCYALGAEFVEIYNRIVGDGEK
jgi:hypothetical protein